MSMPQKIHQPYGKLFTWEIKQALSHANPSGPGTTLEVTTKHRIRLDITKVDHFVEFTNRPYFYQEELQTQPKTLSLTYESFEDFARKVKSTLYSIIVNRGEWLGKAAKGSPTVCDYRLNRTIT